MVKLFMFLIVVVSMCQETFGQDTTLSKININRILKDNIKGTNFNWKKREWSDGTNSLHLNTYNCWITCNDDSIYHKSDTIKMYNYRYYNIQPDCDWHKEWSFSTKNIVNIFDTRGPYGIGSYPKFVKIFQHDSKLYIEFHENGKIIDSFIILGLGLTYKEYEQEKEPLYVMTLLRQKK